MRCLPSLLLLALLAGCGQATSDQTARAQRREAREQKALEHVRQPPGVKTHAVGSHQLIVVELPVAEPGGFSLGHQTCFIFRDAEFQTSSVSCPSREVYLGGGVQ